MFLWCWWCFVWSKLLFTNPSDNGFSNHSIYKKSELSKMIHTGLCKQTCQPRTCNYLRYGVLFCFNYSFVFNFQCSFVLYYCYITIKLSCKYFRLVHFVFLILCYFTTKKFLCQQENSIFKNILEKWILFWFDDVIVRILQFSIFVPLMFDLFQKLRYTKNKMFEMLL